MAVSGCGHKFLLWKVPLGKTAYGPIFEMYQITSDGGHRSPIDQVIILIASYIFRKNHCLLDERPKIGFFNIKNMTDGCGVSYRSESVECST